MLERVLSAISHSKLVDQVVVAVSAKYSTNSFGSSEVAQADH